MDKTLQEAIDSLEDIAKSIIEAYSDDSTMTDTFGWNFPALNRHDFALMALRISDKIKKVQTIEINNDYREQLEEIPIGIEIFKKNTLQYLFTGNGVQAIPAYMSLIHWIEYLIQPLFEWETLQDNNLLPIKITRKLKSIQSELNEIIPKKEDLENQIELIKNATETAESLPTDIESLKEARSKVNKFSTDSAELYGKIDTYFKNVEKIAAEISKKQIEANRLVEQCEEAYKITTTKGLAGAFESRANKLANSMIIWVLGLISALMGGIYIGSHRFEMLNKAMSEKNDVGYIWIQIFLSIISLGAPIWFAWIATKQIGQRFKLSEDYAYKASLAKAYEGYKKEAARIDEDLEIRLFNSALMRLEEAPLRLMDSDTHGSPWHEFFTSSQFKEAIEKFPDLKTKFLTVTKPKSTTNKTSSIIPDIEGEAEE